MDKHLIVDLLAIQKKFRPVLNLKQHVGQIGPVKDALCLHALPAKELSRDSTRSSIFSNHLNLMASGAPQLKLPSLHPAVQKLAENHQAQGSHF